MAEEQPLGLLLAVFPWRGVLPGRRAEPVVKALANIGSLSAPRLQWSSHGTGIPDVGFAKNLRTPFLGLVRILIGRPGE